MFFYLLCVCWGGGGEVRFSTSPSVKKITGPLLLIMTGPYNKKSQGSLRRLSFLKILLVKYKISFNFICLYKHHTYLTKQWLTEHTFIQSDSEGSLSTFVNLYLWK